MYGMMHPISGIEPWTSCTQSEHLTTRLLSSFDNLQYRVVYPCTLSQFYSTWKGRSLHRRLQLWDHHLNSLYIILTPASNLNRSSSWLMRLRLGLAFSFFDFSFLSRSVGRSGTFRSTVGSPWSLQREN